MCRKPDWCGLSRPDFCAVWVPSDFGTFWWNNLTQKWRWKELRKDQKGVKECHEEQHQHQRFMFEVDLVDVEWTGLATWTWCGLGSKSHRTTWSKNVPLYNWRGWCKWSSRSGSLVQLVRSGDWWMMWIWDVTQKPRLPSTTVEDHLFACLKSCLWILFDRLDKLCWKAVISTTEHPKITGYLSFHAVPWQATVGPTFLPVSFFENVLNHVYINPNKFTFFFNWVAERPGFPEKSILHRP